MNRITIFLIPLLVIGCVSLNKDSSRKREAIVIEKAEHCYMVSMNYGEPSDSLRVGLQKQLTLIEDKYLNKLEKWDGDTSAFEDCTSNLVKVLLESTVTDRSEVA